MGQQTKFLRASEKTRQAGAELGQAQPQLEFWELISFSFKVENQFIICTFRSKSTHKGKQLLFSRCFFSSKVYFDLFWNLFQSFWALMTYLCEQYKINILFWSLLTKVNNLHFIRFLKFQQVDRASLLCYFETLGTQMGYLQSIII